MFVATKAIRSEWMIVKNKSNLLFLKHYVCGCKAHSQRHSKNLDGISISQPPQAQYLVPTYAADSDHQSKNMQPPVATPVQPLLAPSQFPAAASSSSHNAKSPHQIQNVAFNYPQSLAYKITYNGIRVSLIVRNNLFSNIYIIFRDNISSR